MTNFRNKVEGDHVDLPAMVESLGEEKVYKLAVNELINQARRKEYNKTRNQTLKSTKEELAKYKEKYPEG